jgi:hypothetical protein
MPYMVALVRRLDELRSRLRIGHGKFIPPRCQ